MRRLNSIIAERAELSSPKFRKFELSVLGLALLLSVACGVRQSSDRAPEAGAAQIAPEEVELAGLRLAAGDKPEIYLVKGTIQNNSQKYTLTEMQLKVVLQDCQDTGICVVIGENVAAVPTNIPAGQTKGFDAQANFKDLKKPQGTLSWHYSVVATKSSAP